MAPKHAALTGFVLKSVYTGGRNCTSIWAHKAVPNSVFPSIDSHYFSLKHTPFEWLSNNPLSPRLRKAAHKSSLLLLNDMAALGASTGTAVQEVSAADWCVESGLPPDHASGFNLQACVQAPISALPLMNNLAVFCFKAMNDWTANPLEADESTPWHCR